MGYYSNLYIKGKHEAFPEMQQALKVYGDDVKFYEDDDYFYITLDSYKWYPSYKDVQSVEQVIDDLGSRGLVTMIREGEEVGDIETYGANPYDLNLYYSTRIVLNGFDDDAQPPTKLKKLYPEAFI